MTFLAVRLSLVAIGLCAVACGGSLAQQQKERAGLAQELSASQLLRKGDASASAGDMTRAEQYYAAALKVGGDEESTVKKLLVVCVADQRYPVALEYAEHYLNRHPKDVEILFAAASLTAAVGDNPRARGLLTEVVQLRPEWPDAHYALATVLREDDTARDAADRQDLEYLRLAPSGPLAESARARVRRNP
ncbi:MAG TPA: hypothetical protein VKP30_16800 [Polyangiaceae bacterium]|nr:hypothetical protein [Polyangiaceae bacterium]